MNKFLHIIAPCSIRYWKLVTGLLFMSLLVACGSDEERGDLVAKVGEHELYSNDLSFLNYGFSDSTAVVSKYIDNWVEEQILVDAATNSVDVDVKTIDRKVEEFRNDLLIHHLQNSRIEAELDTIVSDQEIETYYENHKADFQLNGYLVKVLYLKVPIDAPELEKIGAAYKLRKEGDITKVEMYAQQYASNFYYDIDNWIYFDDLLKEIPLHDIKQDQFILKRSKTRFEENGFNYFLNIVDYKLKNSTSPLNFERNNIKARIINLRIKDLREKIKNDIIRKAYEDSKVKLY